MKIAIVGYGIEGKSAYRYFKNKYPEATFAVYDESAAAVALPDGVESHLSQSIEHLPINANIVVRSPSVNPQHITTEGRVTSVTKEFFKECPALIVGVTGTKGKGTTASLIYSILQADGKKSWLVGNIGVSALDVLGQVTADDIVVYELSSFQLWDLDISPHIAVVLMIEPDHLDVHENLAEYVEAKSNIRKYQSLEDVCIYHPTNKLSEQIALSGAQKSAYKYAYPASSRGVYVKENTFFIQNHPICSIDKLKIPGQHNIENACAAISAVLEIDGITDQKIAAGLSSFEGLPHRLKFVREIDGVKYFDDSIATTPGSAIAAIRSFDEPKVLILGGSDKGADFSELYQIIKNGNVKQVITVGAMSEKIAKELMSQKYEAVTQLGMTTMADIVSTAKSVANEGDIVILSPACASFDMFKSYTDRGDQFIVAVEALV